MFGGFGPTELIIIAGIIVLLFGAKKLPGLGGAIGESIKNFKKGVSEGKKEELPEQTKESTQHKE